MKKMQLFIESVVKYILNMQEKWITITQNSNYGGAQMNRFEKILLVIVCITIIGCQNEYGLPRRIPKKSTAKEQWLFAFDLEQNVQLKIEFVYDPVPILARAKVAHVMKGDHYYKVGLKFVEIEGFQQERFLRYLEMVKKECRQETEP